MSDTSAVLALPYIQPAQAQKHVTHNEALRVLDALVQMSVAGEDTAPPPVPETGARYIVGTGATAAWTGHDGDIALWDGAGWEFYTPRPGWSTWRQDSGGFVVFDGAGWAPLVELPDSLAQLGVNATPDGVNRLSVASEASLFSHDGTGHQVKINKAGAADTASLLFQTGWSGRVEMGTAGSDDFALKVSADGTAWTTALSVAAGTGVPDLAQGATIGGQMALSSGNLLGPVSESAGQPTGAVIERGSNAQGDYVRFADGLQICTAEVDVEINTVAGAIYYSGSVRHDFAMPFIDKPAGSGSMSNTVNAWVNGRAGSATHWTFSAFSHRLRGSDKVQLIAIGRWF